eukprot:4803645-Lingulodinium_polyedra.AAC.1
MCIRDRLQTARPRQPAGPLFCSRGVLPRARGPARGGVRWRPADVAAVAAAATVAAEAGTSSARASPS